MDHLLLAPGDPRWDAVLARAPHDVYQLPAYTGLMAEHEGGEAGALLLADGVRELLIPIIRRPLSDGGWDATTPYGYPGPVGTGADDPAFFADALRDARSTLADLGCVSLFIRLHPLFDRVPDDDAYSVVLHGDVVVIDLTLSDEERWRQTRENHRRQIKRARQEGFEVVEDDTDEGYAAFRAVYEATMCRLDAAPFYFFPETHYQLLRHRLGDLLTLKLVKYDGQVAAAGLFFEVDGIVQYHLSGTDDAFLDRQPTKLLIDDAARWARDRGNRWLFLGGGLGAADDALLHFKAGFSPLRRSFRTLRMVVDEPRYRALLPVGSTGAPLVTDRFFPAYRAR